MGPLDTSKSYGGLAITPSRSTSHADWFFLKYPRVLGLRVRPKRRLPGSKPPQTLGVSTFACCPPITIIFGRFRSFSFDGWFGSFDEIVGRTEPVVVLSSRAADLSLLPSRAADLRIARFRLIVRIDRIARIVRLVRIGCARIYTFWNLPQNLSGCQVWSFLS